MKDKKDFKKQDSVFRATLFAIVLLGNTFYSIDYPMQVFWQFVCTVSFVFIVSCFYYGMSRDLQS